MLKSSQSFLGALKPIVAKSRVEWKSRFFTASPVSSPAEAVQLVRRSNEVRVKAELDNEVERLGGTKSAALWNEYFKSYDKVVGYCDGYVGLLEKANAILPLTGRVIDIGSGTGNFSARLLSEATLREVLAVDQSATGLKTAKAKLGAFDPHELRFQLQSGDIRKVVNEFASRLDGAVMNNVLYTLSYAERLPFLKRIFQILKPEAPFYLCDPSPQLWGESPQLEIFLENIAADAARNLSPMNGFDVALIAHINRKVLCTENAFLSSRDLSELALSAGFSLVEREAVYYGTCTYLHLRKAPRRFSSRPRPVQKSA